MKLFGGFFRKKKELIANFLAKFPKKSHLLLFSLALLGFFTKPQKPIYASSSKNITIFCDPSLSIPVVKIARNFSQKNNAIVATKFGVSSELIDRIDQGEPSDVFISANLTAIEFLRQKGLIDVYNIAFIASDKLILATSKNNKNIPPIFESGEIIDLERAIKIIAKTGHPVLLDRDGYSSNYFAKNFLNQIQAENLLLRSKDPQENSSLGKDLTKNENLFTINFYSQITKSDKLRIIKTKENPVISYQAMAIAGNNMEVAREFLNYLKSESAKEILRESSLIID